MSESLLAAIQAKKVIAICRGIYGEDLHNLVHALYQGGIRLMEVTFDQKDPQCLEKTPQAIAMVRRDFPHMAVGAGTVITQTQLEATVAAGGQFIISPNTDAAIIEATKKAGLVSIPGAMTPTEILQAHRAGADFVKLFPCAQLGSAYVKAICAPINHVGLMATGGIDASNLADYLALGMVGAGIGGKLCDKKLVAAGAFDQLQENARVCAQIAAEF